MAFANDGGWNYSNPVKVLVGAGRLRELPSLVDRRRPLLVTTPGFTTRGLTSQVCHLLNDEGIRVLDTVQPNPDYRDIEAGCQALLGESFGIIVGLGGGSAIDTAKALSFMLSTGEANSLKAYLEDGVALHGTESLPVIAIPTTAGTGSEVTPFATIWDKKREKKYSLTTPDLYPEAALLDPVLTLSLSKEVTLTSGLDALSHSLEALWNRNSTPITTAYAIRSISIIVQMLPLALNALDCLEYRTRLIEASFLSGLAISQTRTALAHSISYPITARYGVPHGLACSFTLPALLEFNVQADDGGLAELIKASGFTSVTSARDGLNELLITHGVGTLLKERVPSIDHLLGLANQMLLPGRADNNLRQASIDDVRAILRTAWSTIVND